MSYQTNLFAPEQFRIHRLQVFNWGTFSNLHDIPISETGFLFVGRSGSGKSTLLDAFSALLIPPKWVDFNAAAREIDRGAKDRNFVSYIRGAWAEQKDGGTGVIATQYLRRGATWSALALSYRNSQGASVVLVQLFWLKGNANNNADVRRHFFIFEKPFDLKELENFTLDIRHLKQKFPEAHAYDEFRPYCDRFCRLLGIENETALKLLHKTQSAKNLGDLNTFLRDFMLEKPPTFEVAERLVNEFAELNIAHQTVVTAREQVQVLTPARAYYEELQIRRAELNDLQEISLGLDKYGELQRKKLLEDSIAANLVTQEGLVGAVGRAENILANHLSNVHDLEAQQRDLGGDRITQWENESASLEIQLKERSRKQQQIQAACSTLHWILPASPQGFADLVGKARQELNEGQQHHHSTREEQFNLVGDRRDISEKFAKVLKEINVLKQQPSNIPAAMLELRNSIASQLGWHPSMLPFVGELIEVRSEESIWQGAIERVLHGFALSLLVEEKNYATFSNFINTTHLGKKLVYFRISETSSVSANMTSTESLINKLQVKEGKYFAWLDAELRQRFDFACVTSIQAFRNSHKAITKEGQIRHGKAKHEKDDRYQVDDRTHWVLGFDNREKLSLFEQQAQTLGQALSQLDSKITALTEKEQARLEREKQYQLLANTEWQEIDTAPLLDRITTIKQQLNEFRTGNLALQELVKRITQQKQVVKQAEHDLRELKVKQSVVNNTITDNQTKLTNLLNNAIPLTLTPFQLQGLQLRFTEDHPTLSLDNLKDMMLKVERKLTQEKEGVRKECGLLERKIESHFTNFKHRWPLEASDMDINIASAPDFFAKLTRLETDGLPAHEQRFFELLQSQSHQNLAALSTHLSQARKSIMERMELVNASLSKAQFNAGTYLFIDVSDRQLTEVREFKQQIQEALKFAWSDDREEAEVRFQIISELVNKLKIDDAEHKRWRESVLDVRLHVEFIGRELDSEKREIEVYRSGAGKSGGQRQKLATTCLAAALRYQLGGNDLHFPIYAPVILDEAFDKADNEFTELAMNIFANFGFQMIVATPLKSVMTLEKFIGGACFVDIQERRHSCVLSIEYDLRQQKLNLEALPLAAS